MDTGLVQIQPRELTFVCEVRKHSSCAVHIANVSDQYVAFKVKTTSPKKYCVKPNVGIIKPKSTYDLTVTMQALKSASPEMQCKDKFLIQSTVAPDGIIEDEITSSMFAKDYKKYIQETKLRVVLATVPNSPAKPPVDVVLKQEASYETSTPKESHLPVLLPVNEGIKPEVSYEISTPKDKFQYGVENFPPPDMVIMKVEALENVKNVEESRPTNVMDDVKSVPVQDEKFCPEKEELLQANDAKEANLKLVQDVDELRTKISAIDTKLVEALHTIGKLKEEIRNTIREKDTLKQQLATLKTRSGGARKVRAGLPLLFVCMVALISLMIGFSFRAQCGNSRR